MMMSLNNLKNNMLGVVFTCLQAFITNVQICWWKLSGISKKIQDLQFEASYKKSDLLVQSFKVITSRHAFCSNPTAAQLEHVVLWHEDFHPLERIMYPGVTLYMIGQEHIFFAEFDNIDEILNTRKHPFLYYAQEANAVRFHRVHKTALIHMTKKFTNINRKVTWVSHVGRCGSTALTQAFNTLPDWTVLAEHPFLMRSCPMNVTSFEEVAQFYRSPDFAETAVAAIRYQLQMIPESQNVYWKMFGSGGHSSYLLPIISNEFPDHKIIVMNRSIGRVADSFCVQLRLTWNDQYIINEMKKNPNYLGAVNGVLNEASKEFWSDDNPSLYHRFYSTTITSLYVLRELCSTVPMMFIDYQSYMSDLDKHLKQVFDYTGVSLKYLDTALQSYKLDSQAGSFLSRDRVLENPPYKRDERVIEKCNKFGKALGFPDFNQDLTRADLKLEKANYIIGEEE